MYVLDSQHPQGDLQTVNSCSKGYNALLWPLWGAGMLTFEQTNIQEKHTHKLKKGNKNQGEAEPGVVGLQTLLLGRLRQEKFKASLGYTVSARPSILRTCPKIE